jgi:hypothetical protein
MKAYSFEFFPEEHFYLFKTRYEVRYAIRFKPSCYVLDTNPAIADNECELVIARIEKPEGQIPPDEQILYTIAAIAEDFLKKSRI